MRKRITSLLLTLIMLLSLVPAMGVTAGAADDTYGYGSIKNWNDFKSYLGSIISRDLTLENDIDYTMGYDDDAIRIDRSQKLDLNGHKIRIDATKRAEFYNLIKIRRGEFTLYDSKGGGAIEVEFARDSKGHSIIEISPIDKDDPAKFTMNGGTLTRVNPIDSDVYGNNGCISDNYFVPFEGGERPQITINGGTINCAYDWNRSNTSMRQVEYMPTALLLRYSRLTVNGGTFNGIVWTDELSWREGDAKPRVLLNGGVFNFPFAVTSLLENVTQLVIDGARFNDGLYVDKRIKEKLYEGNDPAMLIKSGVFDASGQYLKLDIFSVTRERGYSSQVKQQVIERVMKFFPNSAIKLNGNIYTSENIGSRVTFDDNPYGGSYYLNLNLKGPIEVIGKAWDLKEVLLDGSPIKVPNIRDGAAFKVAGSVPIYTVSTLGTHELVYRWYDLAKELRDAGWYYEIECGRGPGLVNICDPDSITTTNGVCEWRYRLPKTPANIDAGQMAFKINLRHATASTSTAYANQYLLRYQVVKDTSIPIETVLLDMVNGDLLPSDPATANPIRKNAMDVRCEKVVRQNNWADNGSYRSKTVVLEARAGFRFTRDTKFVVKNAGSVTAEWVNTTDGGKTCVIGIKAQECTLLTEVRGRLNDFYMGRQMGDAYITADSPAGCTFEIFEYACLGVATNEWEPIDDDREYYEYYFYIVPPSGYAVRPGRTTVDIIVSGGYWKDGTKDPDYKREAKYGDWMTNNSSHYSYGYSWSIGRPEYIGESLFPEYERTTRTLYLTIKEPVAGENPNTDSSYKVIGGLPDDVTWDKFEWNMDKDTVFQAGKEYILDLQLLVPKEDPDGVWAEDPDYITVYINGVNCTKYNAWQGFWAGTENCEWGISERWLTPISGDIQTVYIEVEEPVAGQPLNFHVKSLGEPEAYMAGAYPYAGEQYDAVWFDTTEGEPKQLNPGAVARSDGGTYRLMVFVHPKEGHQFATATEKTRPFWVNGQKAKGSCNTDGSQAQVDYTFTFPAAEAGAGVAVSGTAVSWNDANDAQYYLYPSTTEDADIRAQWKTSGAVSGYTYTGTGGTISDATVDGKAMKAQTFSFGTIPAGEYKLVIFKPGKYVPKIVPITVESTALDLGQLKLWLYGDVNYDGVVTNFDASQINRYVAGLGSYFSDLSVKELTELLLVADVNGDGIVTNFDAGQINRYVAGLGSCLEDYR